MLAPVFESILDKQTEQDFDLFLRARNLWARLEPRLGIQIDRAGALAVGSAAYLAEVETKIRAMGLPAMRLPRSGLEVVAPGLGPNFTSAILTREDWRIDPSRVMEALIEKACAAGVTFVRQSIQGRDTADYLVVATGASQDFFSLAPELKVMSPIKGQILNFPGLPGPDMVLRGEGAYGLKSAAGLIVGATMEVGRGDFLVDETALTGLRQAAGLMFPDLRGVTSKVRVAVRGATPDGLPLVGPVGDGRVLLAVGARRNGWLLAPLLAETIRDYVMGREPGPLAARLHPARFEANLERS